MQFVKSLSYDLLIINVWLAKQIMNTERQEYEMEKNALYFQKLAKDDDNGYVDLYKTYCVITNGRRNLCMIT